MANITVDVSDWVMRDFIGFFKAARDQDFDKIFSYLSKAIVSWDFKGDPKNPSSFEDLKPEEYTEASEVVTKALVDRFQRK